MELLKRFLEGATALLPAVAAIAGAIVVIVAVRFILQRRYSGSSSMRFRVQMFTLLLSLVGLLVVVIVLPVSDSLRGQLLSLIGILLSAAIALSSTTFIGNIMAGFMLRVVRSFRSGDFIQVGDSFGKVSERGLFHVEIQTEDRDLTTMPNLYLVTHPVKVIRASGTIVSAEVSLGYDVARARIEKLMIQAAREVPLEEPFVHILDLGDFSVTYRVAGLLVEVKHILSTRSRLRELVLDKLHADGIEIVSPTFMNTRAVPEGQTFIPPVETIRAREEKPAPEKVVFDKADQAESLEKLRERYEALGRDIESATATLNDTENPAQKEELTAKIERLQSARQALIDVIKRKEEEQDQ
ncbi:MAG: mechanosensitive ion channel [Candidatus Zixiibacteriota bacterium]|nr:MAG: mechanosensitive ion channel [candidate division Zixibacteria bacterium]